ncbi:MAG: NifU family protein [Flavobacteriaceae bacterium]|nr:NifU family protein [Flavobacteriaceae bacterium]
MNLRIEKTDTDTILKIVSDNILVNGGSYQYNNIDEASDSLLAQQLFHLPFVKKIFITANFIAIERYSIVEWSDVQEEVKEQIENYISSGKTIVTERTTNKLAVEIYAENTPNPNVMKFGSNLLITDQAREYKSAQDAESSPLALELFNFPFVKEVYIAENYISVTKQDNIDWAEITYELRDFIRTYIFDKKVIINTSAEYKTEEKITAIKSSVIDIKDLDDVSKKIVEILDEYIKPAVANDGGNIMFKSYDADTKTVSVVLQGACSGCPSSTITLKSGIETMLKDMLPNQIEEVIAING